MIILAHRGFWEKEEEKNTDIAFERAFSFGFGVEFDIRDYCGDLVVAHNIASDGCLKLKRFFEIYKNFNERQLLALNIKSDGLQDDLKKYFKKYNIENYFVFDMSVPDGLEYLKHGLKVFTRQSEYEKTPSFYDESEGVWLDEFHNHWISEKLILEHLKHNKKICIVSPELHLRDFQKEWLHYKKIETKTGYKSIILCTDYPEKARDYFHD